MAATSTLKLLVDDKEYEASLKQAKQGMQDLQQSLEKAGKSFEDCDKAVVDYAKGLGQMEATSKTAKGQIGEMSSAFVELSRVYQEMTDQEKQSPVGQALSQSLETLKQRTIDAKNELANLNKQLEPVKQETQQTGGVMDMLKDKLTINIDAMKLFEFGMKAAGVALDTLRGAIESTEAGHDALARAMAATDSITNQFLRSLANADFSNFITGLGDIVNKAVEAYNALDEFESYAARFNPYQQAKESEIQTKMMQARAAKAQGDTERAERLNEEAKRLIDELATSTREYGKKQAESGFAAIKNLMGTVDISDQQIAWFADPKNWKEANDAAESFRKKMEEIDKLGQSSITATSYDQRTRTQNRQRQREIEASITQQERQAYTMMNLRDSGESKEAAQFLQALRDIYGNVLADSRIESLRARADRMSGILTGTTTGGGSTRTQVATPQQQAAKKVEDAEYEYAKTLEQAAIDLKAGTYDEVGEKKKELQALDKLWQAYGDAYHTYADPKYKDAQDKTAAEIIKLGGEVKGMTDAQEAAKKAAQELAAAEKKLADAQQKLADARATGSATAIYKAQQEVDRQRENVQKVKYEIDVQAGKVPDWLPKDSQVTMTVNVDDVQALEEIQKIQGVTIQPKTFSIIPSSDEWLDTLNGIEELEIPDKEISVKVDDAEALEKLKKLQGITIDPKTVKVEVNEDNGKTNFENLQQTIQAEVKFDQMKVDEATLHTILKDSIQRGIDTTRLQLEPISDQIAKGIDVPEKTWQKILDDYNKLREQIGEEPINIDFKTGNLNKEENKEFSATEETSKLVSGLSQVASGLQNMGVKLPESVQKILSGMQGVISVIQGISTIMSVVNTVSVPTKIASETTNTTALTASTVAMGLLTAALSANTAALAVNSATNVIPGLAHGGIVPHAANGYYVPGRSYSGDNTPIMANAGELVLNTSSQQTLANDIMMAQALVGMIENMFVVGNMSLSRSQQGTLSSQMNENGGMHVVGEIQGEKIVLVANRFFKRTGQGEIVTW